MVHFKLYVLLSILAAAVVPAIALPARVSHTDPPPPYSEHPSSPAAHHDGAQSHSVPSTKPKSELPQYDGDATLRPTAHRSNTEQSGFKYRQQVPEKSHTVNKPNSNVATKGPPVLTEVLHENLRHLYQPPDG